MTTTEVLSCGHEREPDGIAYGTAHTPDGRVVCLRCAEREEIERRVNEIIQSDLPITEHFLTREEAAKAVSLARLPDDAGNTIRIVRVGDYDACPCSGPHVTSSREIGTFKIASTDFQNGVLRIRFKLNA